MLQVYRTVPSTIAMTSFATFSLSARLMRWTSLSLCLAPLSALATAPTVKINGTSIFGTSQLSVTNVTVEFFGGQYTDLSTDFVAHSLTYFCTGVDARQGYRLRNRLLGNYVSRRPWRLTLSLCLR